MTDPREADPPGATPSRTALMSAAARAAHRLVDDAPLLLDDPLSEQLLGEAGTEAIGYHRLLPHEPVLAAARVSACVRQRLVEMILAGGGDRPLVLLGAGLDTSGLRHAARTGARVVEVDLPEVLAWKRAALARADLAVPDCLRWVEADLRMADLGALLRDAVAGAVPAGPGTLVSWLGVSMYLTETDVERTLGALATLGPGTTLVMDHILDPASRDDAGRGYAQAVSSMAGAAGEPWRWTAPVDRLDHLLDLAGWTATSHLTEREAAGASAWTRTDGLAPGGLAMLTIADVRATHG